MKIGNCTTKNTNKTILIAAGGTGGHIFPALAVAQELKKRHKTINIIWFGSKVGMEGRIIAKHHFPLFTVSSVGLRGKSLPHLLKAPFLLALALVQTLVIFTKTKPDIVLAMGGFSSGLAGVCAYLFRVPLLIHEQNAIAGLTNKILAKIASKTYQAFPNTFTSKINAITIGNPVTFIPQSKRSHSSPVKNVLVIGGSLGATIFNKTIPQLTTKLNIIHQSGKGHFETLKAFYKNSKNKAQLIEFIDDMASLYVWADIVICRAGAMTISELMLTGSASILVPFPYASGGHQNANAKILSDNRAAILLPQTQLSPQKLDEILANLSAEQIQQMGTRAKALAMPNSCLQLADEILKFR